MKAFFSYIHFLGSLSITATIVAQGAKLHGDEHPPDDVRSDFGIVRSLGEEAPLIAPYQNTHSPAGLGLED